jgi:hypothetical protein
VYTKLLSTAVTLWFLVTSSGLGQTPQGNATPSGGIPQAPTGPVLTRKSEVGWRLAPSEQEYGSIEGDHLKRYVTELTAISRRYRDNGHPQFWGRLIGTESDEESAQWMLEKLRKIGLTDVHQQMFDMPPQWMSQSWSVTAEAPGKTLRIDTAQPTYLSPDTPPEGLDLEGVYVGLASDADLAMSPDVLGKAVFFYSSDNSARTAGISEGAMKRLSDRGAASVFAIPAIGGNKRIQFYPTGIPVPSFSVGQKDGLDVRDLIGRAGGRSVRIKIHLDVKRVPNLRTSTVWGSLPGTTDETVYIVAHRDGWFEGANDNAAGVATLLGVAEYFAKIPQQKRRRTIIFVGTSGHHNGTAESIAWLAQHKELFAKAALIFNCEHTGSLELSPNQAANAPATYRWYAGGTARVAEIAIKAMDAFGLPTFPQSSPRPLGAEITRFYQYAPSIELINSGTLLFNSGYVWHSDQETDDTISTTGLAAVARTYAKIITDTDSIPLRDLRMAENSAP